MCCPVLKKVVMAALPLRAGGVTRTGTARSSRLVLAGGVAAVLSGLLMGVHEWWDDRVPGIQEGVVPSALHATWVGLMFVGFLGLGALQRPAFGRFGRISSVVAVLGSGSLFVMALRETWGFAHLNGAAQADPPLPILVVIFAVLVAMSPACSCSRSPRSALVCCHARLGSSYWSPCC